MTAAIRGIDVSNSQPRDLAPLIGDAKHVVVKLYLMVEGGKTNQTTTLMQAQSAKANGCRVSGYVWGYRTEDPRDTARQAVDLFRRAGMVGFLGLDMETYTNADKTLYDPGPDGPWIRAFVDEVRKQGQVPVYVAYSALWWIRGVFPGGEDEFAKLDDLGLGLWLADYDHAPTLATPLPKGNWTLVGKQYWDRPVDQDVFDPTAFGGTVTDHLDLANVLEENQFDPQNYDTYAEYATISEAACSAASLAAVSTDYGHPMNISGGLRLLRATGDDVTPQAGLLNRMGAMVGIAKALTDEGVPSSVHPWDEFTRETFKEVLHGGRPIICQMENYLRRGIGHFLVVDGLIGDGTAGVTVADSNAGSGKREQYLWEDLWAEMSGGHAVWPDDPRPDPVEDGMADQALADENQHLKDALAAMTAERDALRTSLYVLRDNVGGAMQAVLNEQIRVTTQAVGPKP